MGIMNRGSEWHRWEPHIHAPGTLLADQYPGTETGWEDYLLALETATPTLRAIGITEYCVTRTYERLRDEKTKGRLPQCDLLFPNIELRLNTGTVKGHFVNIHLLVCPDDPEHIAELNRFLAQLSFDAFGDRFVCTPADLARLGRKADPSQVEEKDALRHGCTQFKVSLENLTRTHREMVWAAENILIAVAGNADGTSGLKEAADATLREEIERTANAIFASSSKQRDFWLGVGKASAVELTERYKGPKPCLWGSDAHSLERVASPAEDRRCWIKGQPTFDALKQACIDPNRAYVGEAPPEGGAASQTIESLVLRAAPWAKTPQLALNPGLIAIIGARGSGKTALADVIAAGCDSYEGSSQSSFLARAFEHLRGASIEVTWQNGATETRLLDDPVNPAADAYPRARYLSQQFVEDLCSVEGMPSLVREMERVVFEAHSSGDREGAVDFAELLESRAHQYRDSRRRDELALAHISDQIGVEIDKSKQVASLTTQLEDKKKTVARYKADRRNLLPQKHDKKNERLDELTQAADVVRGHIRQFVLRRATLRDLKGEIQDVRKNQAPRALRALKQRHDAAGLDGSEWDRFLLTYSGDVDSVVAKQLSETEKEAAEWKGTTPKPVDDSGSFLSPNADLSEASLTELESEISRLQTLVAADVQTARKVTAITKRLAEETAAYQKVKERLDDCKGAKARAETLVTEREQAYARVFQAIVDEERVLNELYAPLRTRLEVAGGTLARLSFTVRRVADVAAWATRGESLFDLRGGPFKGIGSLEKEAQSMLAEAWTEGDAAAASLSMASFRDKHQDALLQRAPYTRADQTNYRVWSKRFAQWLYSTDHIKLEYAVNYDGTDITKLSPGTRGIVLLLLYLALDDADDRPLIIDQPEENLDPKSVYDELVPLFQRAKQKRQIIMVTHNANLVINADADQVIVAEASPSETNGLPGISYLSGGLDEQSIRSATCDILEGGELAFKERARRLRIALAR